MEEVNFYNLPVGNDKRHITRVDEWWVLGDEEEFVEDEEDVEGVKDEKVFKNLIRSAYQKHNWNKKLKIKK